MSANQERERERARDVTSNKIVSRTYRIRDLQCFIRHAYKSNECFHLAKKKCYYFIFGFTFTHTHMPSFSVISMHICYIYAFHIETDLMQFSSINAATKRETEKQSVPLLFFFFNLCSFSSCHYWHLWFSSFDLIMIYPR